MLSGKLIIFAIILGLMGLCWGKWCESSEVTFVKVMKPMKITKLVFVPVKCDRNDPGKSCKKPRRISAMENRLQWEPRNETKSVCCSGYMEELGECMPICENVCVNAECIEPNICKCLTGYEKFSEEAPYKCVPVCSNCDHGTCIKPNVCLCSSGYKRSSNGNTCVPDCYGSCPYGQICSAPNTCTPDENLTTTSTEDPTTSSPSSSSSSSSSSVLLSSTTLAFTDTIDNFTMEEYSDGLLDAWYDEDFKNIIQSSENPVDSNPDNETLVASFEDEKNPLRNVYAISLYILIAVVILLALITGIIIYLVRKKHEYKIKEGPDHVITLKSLQ